MTQEAMVDPRKIIHIDMDAFFAAVEQRNNPFLRGKPVIVGGEPGRRGVVAACSYEARRFGIHSAMASKTAIRLCPRAIFVKPNFTEYCRVSEQIMTVMKEYTNIMEPLSIDEAYLDVTESVGNDGSATMVARAIKDRIRQATGLTASAGVSYNKFLAKVASDYRKPDGLMVVPPQRAAIFIEALPIGKFFGVGRATEERMIAMGIRTGADLKRRTRHELTSVFGKMGLFFHDMAWGHDHRPVCTDYVRKSIGKEVTLDSDIDDTGEIDRVLQAIALRLVAAIESHETSGRTLTLKVKYDDFSVISRSSTEPGPIVEFDDLISIARVLLGKTEAGIRKVRLLGLTISGLAVESDTAVDSDRQLQFCF